MASLVFLAAGLIGLSLWAAGDERKAEEAERWQHRMQRLAGVMSELLPELAARKGNLETIERNARELADLSHRLTAESGKDSFALPPDGDPSIALLSGRFDLDARHAYQAIRQGDVEYGKQLLRSATSYCIACHTRHDQGPELPTLPLDARVASLSRIERAELFAATLQFDKALVEYRAVLSSDARAHWLDWERALHHALAIAVRVKQDPELAGSIVELVLAQPAAPQFLKRNATRWAESISLWKAEPKREEPTEEGLNSEMKRLLNDARRWQEYAEDRAADILYLRASATAHALLRKAPDGVHTAEAIRVLGMAYDILSDPQLWPMQEIYYEACIRKAPHTSIAEDCYRRYEETVYLGYSGSGGTYIPEDVIATLGQLKQLALPRERSGERGRGELLYEIYCSNCHGDSGEGDGPMAEILTRQPANLRLIRARNGGTFPRAEIHRTIDGRQPLPGHGSEEMPLWGLAFQVEGADSSQEQEVRARIEALVDYLASLQGPVKPE